MSTQKKITNKGAKAIKGAGGAVAYNPPPDDALVFERPEKFFYVGVCKGATRQEIVAAVDKALKANDVPFFNRRTKTPSPALKASAKAMVPMEMQAEYDASSFPEDALLILVQQEGW